MCNIQIKTVYSYNGKEFNSLNKVQEEVTNNLGKLIDKVSGITAKERLAFLELLETYPNNFKRYLEDYIEVKDMLKDKM